jgi:hypothetical protein
VAYSYVYYTGTGSATDFTVPFDYLDKADVKVVVNGNLITPTWLNDHSVTISPAPVQGSIIKIYRETKRDSRIVDFVDGSVLTESDLDKANQQSFYVAQEAFEIAGDAIKNIEDYTDQARQYADLAFKYERLSFDHRENARDAEDQSGVYKDLSGTYAEQAQLAAIDAEASKNASINFASSLSVGVTGAPQGSQPSVAYDPETIAMNFSIPPGPQGSKGDKGDTGNPGPAGAAATVTVGNVLTAAPNANAVVTNSGTTSAAVLNFSIPRGADGVAGPANTLSIGTVTGGTSAAATLSGSAPNQVLNLTLPKGDKGDAGDVGPAGPANTLSVGTVSSGTTASASITGTAPNQTLNLTLPKGDTGSAGPTGPAGPTGNGIASVVRTSGTGAAGTSDTYTITYTDSTTSTFTVWNGTNGTGAGTVTSVDLTAPTGFSVSGNPVTSSGSLALSFASGYSLPTNAKQTNWDTAYGWGNHASAGYLTSSAADAAYQPLDGDLTSIAGLSGTSGILKKTAANTWTLDTSSYLTSYTETDPVFNASAAKNITSTNITNWNTAYGWGNHASAGYLTSSAIGITVQGFSSNLAGWSGISTSTKQDTLVSGTNIKTVNGTSILGSGNISIASGSGDVVGPASSTDNALVRFDGTTGKLIQDSAVTVDDTNGSLTFGGTGTRFKADFSNASFVNRAMFQTTTANGATGVGAIPNGTNTTASFRAYGKADPDNSPYLTMSGNGTTYHTISSSKSGTATALGILFSVDGNTGTFIDTVGNVGVGTTSPTTGYKLDVVGNTKFQGSIAENVFAVSGTTPALSPTNGTIQTWTLSANSTPTVGTWNAGESITLMVLDGTAFTITWPTITWVGGSAPTLDTTKYTVIELWKVGTVIYGALVGAA